MSRRTPAPECAPSRPDTTCPACGCEKWAGYPFCNDCAVRLPFPIRLGLYRAPGDGFEKAFAAALDHLTCN